MPEFILTMAEARAAMGKGLAVLHRYFVDGEWIRQDAKGNVIDENGHVLPDFWQIQGRIAQDRLTGWAIHRATPYGDTLDFQAKTAISGKPIHVAATPHGEQYSVQKPEDTIYWEGLFEGVVVAQSGEKRRVFAHLNEHFFALSLKRLDAATGGEADRAATDDIAPSDVVRETPVGKGGPHA